MNFTRELTWLLVALWALSVAAFAWLVSKDALLRLLNKADAIVRRSVVQFAMLFVFVFGMWFYAASKGERGQVDNEGAEGVA